MAKHEFQTEVNQLLKLIIHSMYSNKDIFLREIVSNASDALDKLKYLTVSDDKYKSLTFSPKIDITFNEDKSILTIQDCGIGMDEADLNNNLGTIARSGTKAFIDHLSESGSSSNDLIGQFGVGFYSAFMAAKKIDVYTRKAGGDGKVWHWSSDGTNSYEVEELDFKNEAYCTYGFDKAETVGSAIEIHLNDDSKDYASRWKVEELIKKYSNHIAFPIYLHYTQTKYDKDGKAEGSENKVDQVNSANALWKKSKSELKKDDYNEFYKSISHDGSDPLMYVHTHAEGTQEYTTLFYVPKTAPFDMYQADYKSGVKLYVKRVFITDDDRELLPSYLRFVRGVIDSEDLPLNVSREILQQNRILENIKSQSVKKLLGEFKKLADAAKDVLKKAESDRSDEEKAKLEQYQDFVKNYNRPMKEGLYSDFGNRDEIAEIIRFKSTAEEGNGDGKWTSFADYVGRMKADQKAIYYITGTDEKNLRASPLLEAYKNKGFEVLIMADDIDDIVIPTYGKYKDYELKDVNRSGSDEELGVDKEEAKKKEEAFKPVQEKIKKALEGRVKDVVVSKRLSDSPACVVIDENDPSVQMERMMRAMGQGGESMVKPILEVNADHAIVKKLEGDVSEETVSNIAEVLLDQSLLVSGKEIKDPNTFVKAMNALIG
ncbi:MAG: molecular chaperone HtpG [Treponema sp.]|nr:molecular chaperone HtpG [Candidatus Treponema equi]